MVLLAKVRPEAYRALHAIADRLDPKLRNAFLRAVAKLRRSLSGPLVAEALRTGDVGALRQLGIWDAFQAELKAEALGPMTEAMFQSGQAAIHQLPASVGVQLRFDLTNPLAVAAINREVRQFLDETVNVTAQGVQAILVEGFRNGIPVPEIARRIRAQIGLHPQYADAVQHYRQGLLDQDVGIGRANALADAYADRLLRLRATTIARTEVIRASSAGQHGLWQTAERQGLLDRTTVKRIWIITPDDRLCPICEDVPRQNPDGVGLEEAFQTDSGPVLYPPVHPQCRCATGLTNLFPEESEL